MGALANDKHELFCQEYIKDLCGTRAYSVVYQSDNEGAAAASATRLLKNAKVRARIEELMATRMEELKIDQNWVVLRLMQISDRCMQAEEVMKWDYAEKSLVGTGEYAFDSTGANRATELLGKHLGMFTDKVQHSGQIQGGGLSPEQFAELLQTAKTNNVSTTSRKGK